MKKNRLLALFAALLLVAAVFSGCAATRALDHVEDRVEQRLDQAEDAVESALQDSFTPTQKLTREEAESIALKDAGLTQTEVTRLHSEYEVDDGRPEWEVDFHAGGWEYDYTIHAETGEILHRDKDMED